MAALILGLFLVTFGFLALIPGVADWILRAQAEWRESLERWGFGTAESYLKLHRRMLPIFALFFILVGVLMVIGGIASLSD